jgi:hypothetical protein
MSGLTSPRRVRLNPGDRFVLPGRARGLACASWEWAWDFETDQVIWRIRIDGRDAERLSGEKFIVRRDDGTHPVSVNLRTLIEWSAGAKNRLPSALYTFAGGDPLIPHPADPVDCHSDDEDDDDEDDAEWDE